MVYCSCGRAIEKVPSWLAGVNVQFVCAVCSQRSGAGAAHEHPARVIEEAAPEPKYISEDTASEDED